MVIKENKMNNNILVTYASSYGATKEIAEKLAELLQNSGLQAEVLPVKEVNDVAPYKAVVLGSAVYVGAWLKEAVEFLKTHEKALAELPVWLFSSGPTGEGDPVNLLEGKILPATLQPIVDSIQPRDVAVFHGYINPNKLNFAQKWLVTKLVKKPMGDFRDWESISTWAASIAGMLNETQYSQ
jgi:menaquinone-dependent protoporphyrinogen oxidase